MTTHELCLFVDGADLTVASTVERLEYAGYTYPAAAADSGVQALVFSRPAEGLADAVAAVVVEAERIPGVCIAREAHSGAVAVFDPLSLEFASAHDIAAPADPAGASRTRASRGASRSEHLSSTAALSQ